MDAGDTTQRLALKRRLADILVEFFRDHLWKIVSGIAGLIVGGVAGYTSVAIQIADLRHTAADLKETVTTLATRDQLKAATDRLDRLEKNWDDAKLEAGTAPVARRNHKGK